VQRGRGTPCAIRDALEVFRAARGVVKRDAGVVRGFELHLIANRGVGCAGLVA
jgi:hypothetical protein